MAKKNLTTVSIEAMKPKSSRYRVGDAKTPGLYVYVTPTGARSREWYSLPAGFLRFERELDPVAKWLRQVPRKD